MKEPFTAEPFEEEPEVLRNREDREAGHGPLDGGDPAVERGPQVEDTPDNEREDLNGPRM